MSTAIQWTDETWNPVVGCTKVSQGCKNCYAKTLHDKRHKAALAGKALHPQYLKPFETVQLMTDRLDAPLHWRKPRRCFVNSVSDLFHDSVPFDFLHCVFAVMAIARQHTFQILTKRPEHALEYLSDRHRIEDIYAVWHQFSGGPAEVQTWPLPNVWLGVSVENQDAADERIPLLLQTPAAVRFLSCEPLLGPVDLRAVANPHDPYLHCLANRIDFEVRMPRVDWVIVGGESGPRARETDVGAIRGVVRQCQAAGVPVFVKQLGRYPVERTSGVLTWPWSSLRDRKGGTPDEWPEDLRVRQFPAAVARA